MTFLTPIRAPCIQKLPIFYTIFLSPSIAENRMIYSLSQWFLLSWLNSVCQVSGLIYPLWVEHKIISWLKTDHNRTICLYFLYHLPFRGFSISSTNEIIVWDWVCLLQLWNVTLFTSPCFLPLIDITAFRDKLILVCKFFNKVGIPTFTTLVVDWTVKCMLNRQSYFFIIKNL